MAWTEGRVLKLKQMWENGISASCIAKELGNGLTRNGVIGKVHRLGISRAKVDTSAELATLRDENAALKDAIDDLPDYIEAFRAFKEKGCRSRRYYAQVVEDIVGIAREAKEALKMTLNEYRRIIAIHPDTGKIVTAILKTGHFAGEDAINFGGTNTANYRAKDVVWEEWE